MSLDKNHSSESFRPIHRPPMARLKIYDDGSSEHEIVRLRKDRTVIGRDRGDVRVPHDQGIESEHLSIARKMHEGYWKWELTDLGSKSGFWVRVRTIRLEDETEFLAGSHCFHFQQGANRSKRELQQLKERLADGSIPGETILPTAFDSPAIAKRAVPQGSGFDRLVYWEWHPQSEATKTGSLHLIDGEYWIGRDSGLAVSLPNDRFLMGQHVQIMRDSVWLAKTHGVRNGMWIRRNSILVEQSCAFQLGEQRFHLSCAWQEDEE
jgi:hypothetical protein